jgi:hypothetical protein
VIRKPSPVAPADQDLVCSLLYQLGYGKADIAAFTGLSHQTVVNVLHRQEVPVWPRGGHRSKKAAA